MSGELLRYTTGERRPSNRRERAEAEVAYDIRHEVQRQAMAADGVLALAAHVMDGLTELHHHRKRQAGNDVELQMLLADPMGICVQQVTGIQRRLYGGWGL